MATHSTILAYLRDCHDDDAGECEEDFTGTARGLDELSRYGTVDFRSTIGDSCGTRMPLMLNSDLCWMTWMPLEDIEISIEGSVLPDDVAAFLREADSRVSEFVRNRPHRVTGFVPSDFVTVYHALRAIAEAKLAPGDFLCEWGSGFGVVASLAAMLEFKVCGIEIERDLVDASQRLAEDFGLPVEFVHGSFIPAGAEAYTEHNPESFWLVTDADDAYDDLGVDPDDFDVVFAYAWPDDESLIASLFEKYAAEEALLLMYNQFNSVSLRRKVGKRPGRSRGFSAI